MLTQPVRKRNTASSYHGGGLMEVCVHAGGFRGVVVLYNAYVFVLSRLPEFGAVCAEAHALMCSFRVGSSSWQWLGVGSPVVPWHSHMPDRR
jgi:hypothetical protein